MCMYVSLCVLLMTLMIDVDKLCDVICSIDEWKQLRCAGQIAKKCSDWKQLRCAGQIAKKCSDASGELKQVSHVCI